MTGGRKNEQFDIVSQAQKIVDEYEKRYFECINDTFFRAEHEKKGKKIVSSVAITVVLLLAVVWRILV